MESLVTSPASAVTSAPPDEAPRLRVGTPAFRRVGWAIFGCGFATFSILYGVQPLLPAFSQAFALSPAEASGALSVATLAMAALLIPMGAAADRFGRKPMMLWALSLAALLSLLSACAQEFWQVLALRALVGMALAGLPAAAMAYLSEEVVQDSIGRAMGLYVAGNALGALSGRLLAGALGAWFSWRFAIGVLALVGIAVALLLTRALPASRQFRRLPAAGGGSLAELAAHCRNPLLRLLFAVAFLLAGCFIAVYNYLGYRLTAPAFALAPIQASWIFVLYLLALPGSTWAGRLADRIGPHPVLCAGVGAMALGLLAMLAAQLALLVAGVALFTLGFFVAHAATNGWVARCGGQARASANGLYLCCFYTGSSLLGSAAGLLWNADGWHGVVWLLLGGIGLLGLALLRLGLLVRAAPTTA